MYLAQRSKATCADAPGLRIDDRLEEKRTQLKLYCRRKKKEIKRKKLSNRNKAVKDIESKYRVNER